MFKRDQKEIGLYAQSSPKAMARVITFVYCTIQQSITSTPMQMIDIDTYGTESRFLWGFKLDAYEWLDANKLGVYQNIMDTWRGSADESVAAYEVMRVLCTLPGLGLVKAGFANQLIFGMTGCLDGHNQAIFEINQYRFKASRYKKGKDALKKSMLDDYVALCDDVGGSEFLWDNWCNLVGKKNNMTGDAISALHVTAII